MAAETAARAMAAATDALHVVYVLHGGNDLHFPALRNEQHHPSIDLLLARLLALLPEGSHDDPG